MKKIVFSFAVLLLISCNKKAQYTEQEKRNIELKVYEALGQSKNLIDSLKEVESDLAFRSSEEVLLKGKITAFREIALDYRDSLSGSINEANPDYEAVMQQLYNWYRNKNSYMRTITLSTEEFEKIKNAQ